MLHVYVMCVDACCYADDVSSRGASEVVYPTIGKNTATEPVSMTPLHKTLQSYIASMKTNSNRLAFNDWLICLLQL